MYHAGLASLTPAYKCSDKVRAHHKRLFVHALKGEFFTPFFAGFIRNTVVALQSKISSCGRDDRIVKTAIVKRKVL
jgi:hypothetical protein